MKIRRSENALVFRETPGCLWVFGLFFAIIGSMFIYGSLGGYSNYNEASPWVIAAHLFGGICAVAAGYWVIFRAPVTTVTIDRKEKIVRLKRRGLSGKHDRAYTFDEVIEFRLIKDIDSDGDNVWSLGVEIVEDKTIKISAISSPDESFKRDLVFQANQFMQKKMPTYKEASELED
ncbi:MAG: hypothetical protein ACT4O9_09115 [Blastocatellia bacterium]